MPQAGREQYGPWSGFLRQLIAHYMMNPTMLMGDVIQTARLCPDCYTPYSLRECPRCHPPALATALARHLREKYPDLDIHTAVTVVGDPDAGGYVHISGKRDLALLLYGDRVFRTQLRPGGVMTLPAGYTPDINLCEPDALERIYQWLDLWQLT